MGKMSKMEAVGYLCQIKKEKEGYVKHLQETRDNETVDDAMIDGFRAREIADTEAEIRALEMAGAAMTR